MLVTDIADHESALAYLFGRINYEWMAHAPYGDGSLKLDRMRDLLAGLGDPQQRFPIVHVAGTKGKGSTCGMLASMLSGAGYRTGLYTSPHFERVEERMCIDGRTCTDDEFVQVVQQVQPVVESLDRAVERGCGYDKGPTYFEITTAAALLYFARQTVDVAVLEVGLGGRLDSTNVCQPEISVITSISLDHTRQLGNTLASIAAEKAGIIKPGVPVVSGVFDPEPAEVIRQVAAERGCTLYRAGIDFAARYAGSRFIEPDGASPRCRANLSAELDFTSSINGQPVTLPNVVVGLPGRHQAQNAAVAIAVAQCLNARGWRVPESAIRRGLSRVPARARTEIVRSQPTVLVDVAHNVASVRALRGVLDEAFSQVGRKCLVFATSRDKDVRGMLRKLIPWFDTVILTRYLNNPRFVEPSRLETIARQIIERDDLKCQVFVAETPSDAWETAERVAAEENDFICATGSFFLAAELRSIIQS